MHVEVFAVGAGAGAGAGGAAAIGGGSVGNTGGGGGCHALGGGGGASSHSGAPRMLLVGSRHTGVNICTFVLAKQVNWSANMWATLSRASWYSVYLLYERKSTSTDT
jgi:hypothetical protein